MKGAIVICCFRDLLLERKGKAAWEKVLETSGLPKDTVFLPTENTSEEVIMDVLHNLCKALDIPVAQATESFGEYWVNSFVPRLFPHFGILVANTRDFIIKLNEIHSKIAKTMKGAAEPKLKYRWKDDNTLLITHESRWTNAVFFVGLIKGAAKYFEEDIDVNIWSSNQMMVKFQPVEVFAGFAGEGELYRLEERQAYQNKA